MARVRDSQKQKVYDSEFALRSGVHPIKVRKFRDIKDAQKFIDRIERSSWFAKTFPNVKRHVKVVYKNGSNWAYGGHGRIQLPKRGWWWSGNDIVVLHEMAHNLTPDIISGGRCEPGNRCDWHAEWSPQGTEHEITLVPAAHGVEFTRIFLDLVRRFMGKDAYEALKGEYRKRKVKVGVRSKVYTDGQWGAK